MNPDSPSIATRLATQSWRPACCPASKIVGRPARTRPARPPPRPGAGRSRPGGSPRRPPAVPRPGQASTSRQADGSPAPRHRPPQRRSSPAPESGTARSRTPAVPTRPGRPAPPARSCGSPSRPGYPSPDAARCAPAASRPPPIHPGSSDESRASTCPQVNRANAVVSSDTPKVVCLHKSALRGLSPASDLQRSRRKSPNMPTNCGSPV